MGNSEITEISVGILGIGTYVPENILTNFDLEKMIDTSNEWILERTGIRERRIADKGDATSDLAARAALKALESAKVSANEIDLIIVATATPDMLFPSTACLVQDIIKAEKAPAFDLSAGCTGFVYGLTVGTQFIKTGLYEKVLVIGAETVSRVLDFTDRNTGILFGDGAGAAVLGKTEPGYGVLGVHLGSDGSGGDLLKQPAGGSRLPSNLETIESKLHYLHMNGNEVFKFAVKIMGEAAYSALKNANLEASDIACLVPHQANVRIMQSAAKRLKLPMEKVVVNVDKYGNTSAASIPLALEEGINDGRIKHGDNIILVGFGTGLTWGACVMKWHEIS